MNRSARPLSLLLSTITLSCPSGVVPSALPSAAEYVSAMGFHLHALLLLFLALCGSMSAAQGKQEVVEDTQSLIILSVFF